MFRKLIGARFYNGKDSEVEDQTARDTIGHGTHVASTAAGSSVTGASYYGMATGTAKGGSPGSRIAVYRVCSEEGCLGSAILAAFDDAISDKVDVLSLSLGSPASFRPDLESDTIAIGAFHAVEKGITVVCSAGNDGPSPATVANAVPWILTVAATTIDRDFESDVVLGGGKIVKGGGINFSPLQKSPVYPLIHAKSAKKSNADDNSASNCQEDSMEENAVKGKIVVCDGTDGYSVYGKRESVKGLGGLGVVVVDDVSRAVAENHKSFPVTVVGSKDAADILSYLNSTSKPVATILPTVTVTEYKPAPAVAYFSSRGPSYISPNILKPDIAAPGVNILAAWIVNDSEDIPEGKEPSLFNLESGTSMACPHVSGVVATIKSQHSEWSPSNINYPSIAISNFTGTASRNISRTVTYVAGDGETVFTATVEAPSGLDIKVIPDELRFTESNQKLSYQVIFSRSSTLQKTSFGSILWTNGKYKVRSPFVVSNEN